MNCAAVKTGFDKVYISVGNQIQKRIIENILPYFQEKYNTVISAIMDGENGERIGSGGALLRVLQTMREENAGFGGKTLFVLTGGSSKRAPNYALPGKATAAVGTENGNPIRVLDAVLQNASYLARQMKSGLLVCCGDIVVDCSGFSEPLRCCTAFCVYESVSIGTRHGVMFPDRSGKLCEYIQKGSAQMLARTAERYGLCGEVPVDAGWLYLSAPYLSSLAGTAAPALDMLRQIQGEANLFEDILPVSAEKTEKNAFLSQGEAALRRLFWDALRSESFVVCCLRQPFLHFGTPAEHLDCIRLLNGTGKTQYVCCDIAASSVVGDGCLLENVRLSGNCRIGSGCLVTDIELLDITVPANTAMCGVRLRDGRYVCCVYAVDPDPAAAGDTAKRDWKALLFYPAASFSESYRLYVCADPSAAKISAAEAFRLADAQYFLDWREYLSDLWQTPAVLSPGYETYRNSILKKHFADLKTPQRIICVKDRVCVELPARINFSGTWTDCMPYCIERGGEVINAAIKVNGKFPICVTAERIRARRIEMCNADSSRAAEIYSPNGNESVLSECNLHRAVFRALSISADALTDHGIRLTVSVSGIMKGSGLGTSSILLYGCFFALRELCGLLFTESDLLRYVFVAEQLMHTGGGWQDQGAMIGAGLKRVFAASGLPQNIKVESLLCSEEFLKLLSSRLVLVSTGQRHFGRFIVTDVMNRYLTREPETLRAFESVIALNGRISEAIRHEDIRAFGECMNLHAKNLDLLSPLIYNNIIRKISEDCMRFADGCSICGAGGGGYLAVLLKKNVSAEQLREALQTEVLPLTII